MCPMTSGVPGLHRGAGMAAAGLAAVLLSAACGGGADASETPGPEKRAFERVMASDTVYAVDDFLGVGFKKSKHYDVEGLPEATDAWYGFWRPGGGDPVDYELRFYASHEDAVEYGTAPAEEVTGDDAVLSSELMTWKEGSNERRTIIGGGGTGGDAAFSGAAARYADFAIFGNVVMLCEGTDSGHSLERCEALVRAVESGDPSP